MDGLREAKAPTPECAVYLPRDILGAPGWKSEVLPHLATGTRTVQADSGSDSESRNLNLPALHALRRLAQTLGIGVET